MNIRQMTDGDLDFAFSLTRSEGWLTETRASFESFLQHDPRGAFIGEVDGERIGICVGVAYRGFGFLGELIVLHGHRGKGYGLALFNHTLGFFEERGLSSVILHGDEPAVPIYERAGFRKVCRALNFLGQARVLPSSESVRPMRSDDLPAVCAMDARVFGADRSVFLNRFLQLAPQHCFVEIDGNGTLLGFITGRIGNGVVAAGPWIRESMDSVSFDLLNAFSSSAVPGPMRIDVLENQTAALSMLSASFPFLHENGHSWKMIRGDDLQWGEPGLALAVGTPATG